VSKLWQKGSWHRGSGRWAVLLPGLLLVLTLFWPMVRCHAAGAQVTDVHAEKRQGGIYIDVTLRIALDPEVISALHNAIAINFELQTEIERPRDWLWAKGLASDSRRYRLEYHALSKTWMVTDFQEQETRTYTSLDGALRSLGHVHAWQVARTEQLRGEDHLIGKTRLVLDVNKLPLPLRLPALFDHHWSLDSDWYLWSPPKVPAGDGARKEGRRQ